MAHMLMALVSSTTSWIVLGALGVSGCSSNDGSGNGGGSAASSSGDGGASAAAGSGANGGLGGAFRAGASSAAAASGAGAALGIGANGPSGDGASFVACTGESRGAEGIPLDMYVMFDHTASMGEDCPLNLQSPPSGNATKWCFATHALAQYFTSEFARGHRAALQFMTVEDFVCEGGPSNGEATAAVPLTLLPAAASDPLVTALDNDSPEGGLGTRIEAALHGIADFTVANQVSERVMIGILITDGDPNGCSENINQLAGLASDHLAQTGIRTFVIGMTGATLDNLEALAVAGGAPEHGPEFCGQGRDACHYWSVGDGDLAAFTDALEQIQGAAAIACEYFVPDPPPGQTLDSDLVNVNFTPASGAEAVIPRVHDAGSCDPQAGGWYYDNPQTPRTIRLCESTCNVVTAAGSGAILDVEYGCETITGPIR